MTLAIIGLITAIITLIVNWPKIQKSLTKTPEEKKETQLEKLRQDMDKEKKTGRPEE